MNVLVDTSVWSQALRRVRPGPEMLLQELAALVRERRVVMIGAVRQELLSVLKERQQFEVLREQLRAFPDFPLDAVDYEEAADCFNRCRAKEIQGSNTDFLICAIAVRRGLSIFTTDDDFARFAEVLPLNLHEVRG